MGLRRWLKYYIPLRWTFTTRYINIINIISFFIIDAFPSLYIVIALGNREPITVVYWFLAFFGMFCFYECGYIFNETICVRFENNPTIRIPQNDFEAILKHIENLITIRIVLGVICSCIVLSRYPNNWRLYIALVLILLIVYAIHNFYRGKINIITMALEVTLKYMIPITALIPAKYLPEALFMVVLTIVAVRLLEYMSKKKFIDVNIVNNVDSFRIRYYIAATVLAIVAYMANCIHVVLIGLPIIFLCYRIASYIAMRKMKGVANVIHQGREHHGTERVGGSK